MKKLLYFNQLLLRKINDLTMIMDCLPGSIYWKDTKGRYLGSNKYAKESMGKQGFEDTSVIGLTDFDLFPTEVAQQFQEHDQHTINSNTEQVLEETLFLPDGSINVHYSIKRPLKFNNKTIGIIGNSINITHLKNIEEELRDLKQKAQQSEKSKNIFLQNIEHDLKTPSGIIELATQRLQQNEHDPEKLELLNNIAFSSKQILDHFTQLIEFSRLNEKKPSASETIELLPFIENIINIHKLKNTKKNLHIESELSLKLPKYITSNRHSISRILSNLLDNAIKFTDKGTVTLRASQSNYKENQSCTICFEVSDTGPGITENDCSYIFEAFFKINNSNSQEPQGSGLGLSIVKELTTQLNGTLSVTSQPGCGSTFICKIPVTTNSQPPLNNPIAHPKPDQSPPLQVMLIEDHEICAKLTVALLKDAQFDVQTACSGEEALILAERQPFDIILTDIGLPDTNGFLITEQIRRQFPHLENTMIFALSAHSEQTYMNEVKASVLDGFLTKPFSIHEFIKLRKQCLAARPD